MALSDTATDDGIDVSLQISQAAQEFSKVIDTGIAQALAEYLYDLTVPIEARRTKLTRAICSKGGLEETLALIILIESRFEILLSMIESLEAKWRPM
ncbi:hypothetical protein A2801_03035 [Candidatus Woesebacteria bacterium RIFCSPHIGHO2_01_FULL_41_10]|uniref:Uncharacterized protein n=1 Tax=Candidatus Woesebacteria bacterium RIFCSPHIGHO2_01_FULL_41_10 TaxID=1802500 RepID=A0A1F7YQM8_9BACT|nr:MAG: hypothetical protein A2801_03035 [Candidatus Woesebacteria bacterium RIFCSPHIGHO2_01_FULL_41_10]